jgi:hypothetical protein
MKTAKMALKIILALALPLNAIASGANDGKQELSIERKLELQDMKLQRDTLERELARSAVTIQVLKDIADPGLMAFYREYDEGVIATGALTALAASVIAMSSPLVEKFPKAAARGVGTGLSVGVALAAVTIAKILSDEDYEEVSRDLRGSAVDYQKYVYSRAVQHIATESKNLEALNQEIESLEK